MIRFIIRALSKSLGFSRVEARGSLLLLILLLSTAIALHLRISYLKSDQREIVLDAATLSWIEQTEQKIIEKPTNENRIETTHRYPKNSGGTAPTDNYQLAKRATIKETEPLSHPPADLNAATADQLQSVRGIGPVLSERIVKFRDLLGGFATPEQIKEVYGLDSLVAKAVLEEFTLQTSVKKLSINSDSISVLAAHPYISYDLARIIINFRKSHGDIENASDLKKIKAIDEATFKRLKPYLE